MSGRTVKTVSAGFQHTCAIAADGFGYCWGSNDSGRLGNSSTSDSVLPVAVTRTGVLSGMTLRDIEAGGIMTCAIASDDKAYCWGSNLYGALGHNVVGSVGSTSPVAVTSTGVLAGKTIKDIATGINHACVLASDNAVYCWGSNLQGQLGNGTNTDSRVPVAVTNSGALAGKSIKSLSAGYYSTCVVASDNKSYCWGVNNGGSLADGTQADRNIPAATTETAELKGKSIQSISAGGALTCIVASPNDAYCSGSNNSGQLGNGSITNSSTFTVVTMPAI